MTFRGHVLLERAVANVCGQARRATLHAALRLQAPAWPLRSFLFLSESMQCLGQVQHSKWFLKLLN